jgi:hypothetical protein
MIKINSLCCSKIIDVPFGDFFYVWIPALLGRARHDAGLQA